MPSPSKDAWKEFTALCERVDQLFVPDEIPQEVDVYIKTRHYSRKATVINEFEIDPEIAKFFGYHSPITVYRD